MTQNPADSNTSADSNNTADSKGSAASAASNTAPATASAALALPDRLSVDPRSPHYNEAVLSREIGIRFKGVERHDVEEYCVSEGWIKVASGRARDRRGNPILIKLAGPVEPYFKS